MIKTYSAIKQLSEWCFESLDQSTRDELCIQEIRRGYREEDTLFQADWSDMIEEKEGSEENAL